VVQGVQYNNFDLHIWANPDTNECISQESSKQFRVIGTAGWRHRLSASEAAQQPARGSILVAESGGDIELVATYSDLKFTGGITILIPHPTYLLPRRIQGDLAWARVRIFGEGVSPKRNSLCTTEDRVTHLTKFIKLSAVK
jgi:hypothetical protein